MLATSFLAAFLIISSLGSSNGKMPGIHETAAWSALSEHTKTINGVHLRDMLQDADRCTALTASHGEIVLDYARNRVTEETMSLLCALAEAAGLDGKRAAMFNGEHINNTEDRAVGHFALRAAAGTILGRAGWGSYLANADVPEKSVMIDGRDAVADVHEVLTKIKAFSEKVRSGEWKGCTGKPLKTIIAIGIGGSYLGPEFVFEALKKEKTAEGAAQGRTLKFLANVDPIDIARATEGVDPETTLVVIVSKTFTTAETMLNARSLKNWLLQGIPRVDPSVVLRQHLAAVSTALDKTEEFGIDSNNVFGFWNWVGGRFSVCSAVGMVPLSLHYGFEVMEQFLAGCRDMDQHFLNAPIRQNIPVLMGLLGVWNSSFLGYSSRALLPYCQALLRFPAHIQQVDMESNGKRVTTDGTVLPFETGELDFGEPGTNGQHSFYQLMHQGRVIPADFIGFIESQTPMHLPGEEVSNHDELMSNFFAQPDALACGKTVDELRAEGCPENLIPHKEFPGNRPSLSLLFPRLDPFTCGQLLAIYEHRTAVQGAIWGVNSFDQWGVQLGKVLGIKIRKQLVASRGGASVEGFNPATTALLEKYLAGAQK